MNEKNNNIPESGTQQTECRQCGECCRKGGPALHLEDLGLVTSGKIPLTALFTIREGEPAFDNVNNAIAPAVTDIIKIKKVLQTPTACWFYDHQRKHCRQYADRPAECQALKCWDVADIEKLYNCRRLTRRHVLAKVKGLWELVEDHQERCDYGLVAELVEKIKRDAGSTPAQQELAEMIRYDESLRQLTHERMKMDPEMMDFLYGRPLSFTVGMFRVKYDAESGEIVDSRAAGPSKVCYRRKGF